MQNRPLITLFSTPMVATWVFDETRRILFDVGDGVAATLDQRVAKVQLVALTHSHRDHIGGLLQFMNLRAGHGEINVIYPRGSGAVRAYAQFLRGFDRITTGAAGWYEFGEGEEWVLPDDRLILRPFRNRHMDDMAEAEPRSVGYQLLRRVPKVRREFEGLAQTELDGIRKERGKEALLEMRDHLVMAVSGDTAPLSPDLFRGCDYLLHECTFLDEEDGEEYRAAAHGHSVLGEVLRLAMQAGVGHLGLYHISRRYDDHQIMARVVEVCRRMEVPFPVSVALPGRYIEDFFGEVAWPGRPTP